LILFIKFQKSLFLVESDEDMEVSESEVDEDSESQTSSQATSGEGGSQSESGEEQSDEESSDEEEEEEESGSESEGSEKNGVPQHVRESVKAALGNAASRSDAEVSGFIEKFLTFNSFVYRTSR
jgi:hypothetical protein